MMHQCGSNETEPGKGRRRDQGGRSGLAVKQPGNRQRHNGCLQRPYQRGQRGQHRGKAHLAPRRAHQMIERLLVCLSAFKDFLRHFRLQSCL